MRSRLRVVALLTVSALLLAACGGGESTDADPQIATLETTAPVEQAADQEVTTPPADAVEVSNDDEPEADPVEEEALTFEDAALDFAQCMRENGYPAWPDPMPGDRVSDLLRTDLDALGIDRDDPDFQETIQLCRDSFEGVAGAQQEFTPDQQAEIQDAVINIFSCVRDRPGYADIPDPDFTAPGGLRGAFVNVFASGEYDLADTLEQIDMCRAELGYPRLGEGG